MGTLHFTLSLPGLVISVLVERATQLSLREEWFHCCGGGQDVVGGGEVFNHVSFATLLEIYGLGGIRICGVLVETGLVFGGYLIC